MKYELIFTAEERHYAQALLHVMRTVVGVKHLPSNVDELAVASDYGWSLSDLVAMASAARSAPAYVDPDEDMVRELMDEYDDIECAADLIRETLRRERARVAK